MVVIFDVMRGYLIIWLYILVFYNSNFLFINKAKFNESPIVIGQLLTGGNQPYSSVQYSLYTV